MADHPENPTALVVSEHQDDDHFAELVAGINRGRRGARQNTENLAKR